MPIVYKLNILDALKEAGYSTYTIGKNCIFGSATMQKFRKQGPLNFNDLEKLCKLLNCQPGDLIGYIPDDES